ncbi:unnamed protein product [Mucor hiemalis]
MSNLVLSNSLSMSLQTSQKEISMSSLTNSPVLMNDSLLLSRYAATIHYLEEKKNDDSLNNSKTPALYHHKNEINDGSALEEEDTESEEDDDEDLLSSSETAVFTETTETAKGKTPLAPPAAIDVSSTSYFTPLTSSISNAPPTIQTYLPQLNLNLYSPCSTPISSIRSSSSSKRDRGYGASKPPSSCFRDTWNTVQNPTNNISSPLKQQKPLYPSSSSIASTIKMDIRSPPQPSQSTSRFMNAFHRFKSSSLSQHGSRGHQNTNNSVAPAEIIQSMKPSPSKSSLADKIKTKFQQLDKKEISPPLRKNSINVKSKKPTIPNSSSGGFSMPRSASISSITNWSSRLTSNKSTTTTTTTTATKNRLSHSTSMTSFLSSKKNSNPLKPTVSLSPSSSSSSLSEDEDNFQPTIPTKKSSHKPSNNGPLSLTKSISSHRLYKNNDNRSSSSSGNSHHSNSSSTTSGHSRPRQPLRAINPNESVRLSRQLLQQQQQQRKKTSVRFNKVVAVKETYSKSDYDRGSDPEAVCTRLTPAMAQHIKEELNAFKLHEMQVHEFSRVHTHFFL